MMSEDIYCRDNHGYILTHTPRQIVEEKGVKFTRRYYQECCFRYGGFDRPSGKLKPMEINYKEYVDSVPDDEYFEKIFQEQYRDNWWGCDLKTLKLAFIMYCAMQYAASLPNWEDDL